jgi:hypothetical protein
MKPTITALAKHIGKSNQTLHHMKKVSPEQFEIMMLGWVEYCKEGISSCENCKHYKLAYGKWAEDRYNFMICNLDGRVRKKEFFCSDFIHYDT